MNGPNLDTYFDPPDDRGWCPFCHADAEDAESVVDDDTTAWRCRSCGEVYDDPIGRDEMLAETKEEAEIARAEERMEEES